jgi:nucleotide-binding universal stress UspA family protein
MIKIKRILFPTDFSTCAGQALKHAVFFAQKYKAELHLIHVITMFEEQSEILNRELSNTEAFIKLHKGIADVKLNEVVELYGSKDFNIVKSLERGMSAAPSILEYASDNDIDLIVLGTTGRRGIGHLLMGSVAEEIVRLSKGPVFTVRESEESKPLKAYNKILVPIDFSDYSGKAISYAKEIASAYDSQLQLLHIIEEKAHPAFSLSGKSSIFDLVPNIEAESRKRIEELLNNAPGPDVKSTIHIQGGNASSDIIKFTSEYSSDLVVIASHGLTGIEHLLLGSVTEKVVRMAPCPVVTIKPFGKSLIG